MSTFVQGPAHDKELVLHRAPIYLRVVVGAGGKIDALDLLEDEPERDEVVHVYRRRGTANVMFACSRRGRGGGRYEYGVYEWLSGVDGEPLRETAAWRAWVDAQDPTPL